MQGNKGVILAQKAQQQERKIRLRWLVAASALPLFGVVAAFGIAPQTDPRPIAIHTVIENLELPHVAQLDSAQDEFWHEERIQRGDTVASLLARLRVSDEMALNFLRNAKDAKTLYQLVPGRTIRAKTTEQGQLLALRYISGGSVMLSVDRQGEEFKTSEQPVALEQRVMMKSGEIHSSLFGATDAANVPDNIAIQLADIFSSDVDFHLDLRKGDRFTVVYETFFSNGEPVKTGRVLAAEFTNRGKAYRAVYFQDPQGRGDYYTPDGKNLRKAFLRSPLEFSRISSGFTSARFHPILQTWRAHKGVDYAAATGTRVKATSDATVAFVGKQNGYGNLIVLQHRGNYSTAYGHLSAFAKGLHKGSKISQGDVIGYVGMTGMATGPHLHYEFRVAGVQHDPFTVAMPVAFPIAPQYKAAFMGAERPLLARLELLRGTNMASLD